MTYNLGHTGQYSTDIRSVFEHLFTTYGKITPQQVKAKEATLLGMHYDISQPVDIVFNAIDDLSELADHALSPMSSQQMIDLAYVIFARQTILQQDIRLWARRPAPERTWVNMLEHFRDAQSDLSSLPTAGDMFQTANHQANAVATMAELVAQRLLESMPAEDPAIAAPVPPTAVANAAFEARELSIAAREAALITQMTEMMTLMRAGTNHNQRTTRNNRGRGAGRTNNDRGRAAQGGILPSPRHYCWTHGWVAHPGAQCDNRAPGHQATATATNMMGGSTNKCYWITTPTTT